MKKKFFSKLLMVALVATVGIFSSCKDYDDDIADVRNTVQQTATDLRTDYTNKINVVSSKVDQLQTSYDNLSKALDEANAQLTELINTKYDAAIKAAEAYSDANLVKAKDAAAAAEKAAKDYAEVQAAAAQAAAISAAKEQVAAAKQELSDALAKANELIATQGEQISNLIKADEILTAAITAAQARADEAYALADKANTLAETNKANLEKAVGDISKLQTDLANLQGSAADKADVAKLERDLAALKKQVEETLVGLPDYNTAITKLTSDLATLKGDLDKQVGFLGENLTAVKKTAEDNAASIASIIDQLAALDKANDLAHEALQKAIDELATKTSNDLELAKQGIEAEIAAANKLIGDNSAAIANLTQTVNDNKAAQDKINEAITSDIAKKAEEIVANTNAIKRLNEIIPTLETTLKEYADNVAKAAAQEGKDAADAAQKAAQKYALDAIKAQAELDKEAWEKAIDAAVNKLIKDYQLNALDEIIQKAASKAQTDAETNAEKKAQEIANKALDDAKIYTDKLRQTMEDNYTTTKDMQDAMASAIAQAYVKVLNDLLRDQEEWYEQTDEKKLTELSPTIFEVAKKAVNEYGVSKADAETLITEILKAALVPSKGTGTYDKDGNEIIEKGGAIMVLIEAAAAQAAEDLEKVNTALDLRLQDIEKFLNTTSGAETLDATVKYWIADAKLAKQADVDALKAQLNGETDSELLKKINEVKAAAQGNAENIGKIMTTLNNVTALFTFLTPGEEGETIDDQLDAYEAVMKALAARIAAMADVVDNLDDKVMEAVNKNLGPQIQNMITSINLYANQHMADLDERYKLAYWNGEEFEYPAGYDNFDHELTFVYTIERGIFASVKDELRSAQGEDVDPVKAEWNYPEGLLTQLKGLKNTRPAHFADDYNYDYEGQSFSKLEGKEGPDFVNGRYRSYEDSILVRVSPTNADLTKAEIALINSKGEDIIADGLVEVLNIEKFTREAPITRFKTSTRADEDAATKETGLWVIKFKLNDDQVGDKWDKYAEYKGSQIVYAVAVKNTDFSTEETEDVDRYVASEYDLSLGLEEAKHNNDFKANGISVAKIHNRYIQAEQSENGTTSWTDDPIFTQSKFRYELTWKNLCGDDIPEPYVKPGKEEEIEMWYEYCWECCYGPTGEWNPECYETLYNEEQKPYNGKFKGHNEIGYTSIVFNGETDGYEANPYACGVNTVDRYLHSFDKTTGVRNMNDGVDNRHKEEALPITFSADQAPAGESGEWAKIDIKFPYFNQCGERTPIRGFFVTMDQHFAIESDNSEMNAWPLYITKNIAKYPYGNGKVKTDEKEMLDMFEQSITLQKGNEGTIWLKDARNLNDGDVIGFRVFAVNLDGTFTDPDGRAFYVKVGNKSNHHELSFHITATNYETGDSAVQDLVNGKNPVAQYNQENAAEKSDRRFFERPAYGPSYENIDDYRVVYTWREGNPAIRGWNEDGEQGWVPVAGTGLGVENDYRGEYGLYSGYAVVKNLNTGMVPDVTKRDFSVEKFFSFKFSKDNVLNNDGIDDAYWYNYGELDAKENGTIGANVKTNSVLGFINPEVADRLIDGETYKITMTIQQLDSKTTWITKNVIDIDITKDMPTKSGLTVKTGQDEIIGGVWKFYVRPLVKADLKRVALPNESEEEDPDGDTQETPDPWKITWNEFTPDFDTDFDADGNAIANIQNLYRWAADVRPWTLDEMFNGIIYNKIVKDENGKVVSVTPTVSKDFYFLFEGVGDFASANNKVDPDNKVENKDKYSTEADFDEYYKGNDAYVVFNTNTDENVTATPTGNENNIIGYRMPYVHYSHIDDGKTYRVLGGKIYRRISATLAKDGKTFLAPLEMKKGTEGFISPVINRDYLVEAHELTSADGINGLKAQFFCALDNELSFPTDAQGEVKDCKYNEQKAINIFGTEVKAVEGEMYEKFAPKATNYAETLFPTAWTTLPTLAELLRTPYYKVDYSSIQVVLPTDAPYDIYEWYDIYFAANATDGLDKAIEPSDAENNSKIKFLIVKPSRDGIRPALNKDYDNIKVQFDIYDVWHHGPKTILIQGLKVLKPEEQAARQAR